MPNYYAHLVYGTLVTEQLPPDLQARLRPEWDSYCLGLYGPDPLFFFHPQVNHPVSQEGHKLHRVSPVIPLERLRPAVVAGTPKAMGYALGYLGHFLLDSACHPYVTDTLSRRTVSHLAMEGEFDRYLLLRDGFDPARDTPMVRPNDSRVYDAAAMAYKTIDPDRLRFALKQFYYVSRLLTRFQGTAFSPLVSAFTRGSETAHGILLGKNVNPYAKETNPRLDALLHDAVAPGAALMTRAADALLHGETLRFLPQVDFSGRPLGEFRETNTRSGGTGSGHASKDSTVLQSNC